MNKWECGGWMSAITVTLPAGHPSHCHSLPEEQRGSRRKGCRRRRRRRRRRGGEEEVKRRNEARGEMMRKKTRFLNVACYHMVATDESALRPCVTTTSVWCEREREREREWRSGSER